MEINKYGSPSKPNERHAMTLTMHAEEIDRALTEYVRKRFPNMEVDENGSGIGIGVDEESIEFTAHLREPEPVNKNTAGPGLSR